MRTFTDEDREEKSFNNNYFGYGVHKVQLLLFENGGTEDGEKEYIEITVVDPEDSEKTDTARVWFTTDNAANYSINTLRAIAVHNASDKAKDKARDAVDTCANTDELVALLNEKLIGKEAWFTKYQDPKRTYTNERGTFKSINKNVYGYEPKLREDLLPKEAPAGGDEKFPGSEPVTGDAAANIPADDDWAK